MLEPINFSIEYMYAIDERALLNYREKEKERE